MTRGELAKWRDIVIMKDTKDHSETDRILLAILEHLVDEATRKEEETPRKWDNNRHRPCPEITPIRDLTDRLASEWMDRGMVGSKSAFVVRRTRAEILEMLSLEMQAAQRNNEDEPNASRYYDGIYYACTKFIRLIQEADRA